MKVGLIDAKDRGCLALRETPPLDLAKGWTDGPPILYGARNRSTSYTTFHNGKPVPIQDFDDVSELLKKYYPTG